jgi:GNAT superfamily N-acetyltransferase
MITTTSFDNILPIWKDYLWPNRQSKIESHSAMLLDGTFDLKNFENIGSYFVYMIKDHVVGCNSGHLCCDGTYRSRGLYVHKDYRNQGIGTQLLVATINQGRQEGCSMVWSYPRLESWNTYKSAGFELISDWTETETGVNAYCKIV